MQYRLLNGEISRFHFYYIYYKYKVVGEEMQILSLWRRILLAAPNAGWDPSLSNSSGAIFFPMGPDGPPRATFALRGAPLALFGAAN